MLKKTITYLSIIFITIGAVFMANGLILAWSPPGASPTGGNVDAPLNVGSTGQSKSGGLILNTGGASIGLVVDEGNVGIGTTNPQGKLDVRGSLCLNNGSDCRNSWPSEGAGGDITAVNAGTGLTGGGTSGSVTINADTSYMQRRVSGICAVGSSIRVINADGSVTCEADDSGGGSLGSCLQVWANYGRWATCPADYVVVGYFFNMGSDPAAGVSCCQLQ